ncbi:nucleotide sugar dehydrogenase [Moorena sp. SIO3A2]|uniref:nucleotide sugar dehydrogenase n=1 Tax=Moorena sp. SIO3A2 TaxID=2607841 RepID=UPI0013BBD964|nr:nucleotide sugar dehydrogenase [Moorena sp. SIO3A2]NER87928.1 nucleotide sugar dehydrogenase [Moorena sp. SIO3A2]
MTSSLSKTKNTSTAPDGTVYAIPSESAQKIHFDKLAQKAAWHRTQGRQIVVVQGLGFVGSAVAAVIAAATDEAGQPLYFVIGVDLPSPSGYWKVGKLNDGLAPIVSPDPELPQLIHEAVYKTQNLEATVSEEVYTLADVIVVDIHLDVLNRLAQTAAEIKINLDSFGAAIHTVGRYMRPDALILIETTVPAGTSEKFVLPILREERALRGIDQPPLLAHAYERVMPGPKYINSIRHFWRTFSGIDQTSTAKARDFLSSFIDTTAYPLWELQDTNSSELAKLLENSYRATNIAFIHEWTLLAENMGINLFTVVDSIRVRQGTHDNMRFPGFGVGGYCLTKDSLLAQWSAINLANQELLLGMTLEALKINHRMPLHTLDLLKELFEGELAGKTIAVCGVAYLPEVADTRNSPTEIFVDELLKTGAVVIVHDPYVTTWVERPNIPVTQDLAGCLRQADGIVLAIPHRPYRDLLPQMICQASLALSSPVLVDAQNIITDEKAELLHDAGCRLLGVGKGHWRTRGYQCLK